MNTVPTKLLLVESDPNLAGCVQLSLENLPGPDFQVTFSPDIADATQQLIMCYCDVVLLDISMTNGGGLEYFEILHATAPQALFILLYHPKDVSVLHQAMAQGACDCINKCELSPGLIARIVSYNLACKRVGNLLRVSASAVKAIGEACPQGVMVSDLCGRIAYTNSAYQRMTGLTSKQLLSTFWIESIYSKDRLRLQKEWRHDVQVQLPFHTQARILHQDHTLHFAEISGAFLHDDRKLHGHVRVMKDITPNGVIVETAGKEEKNDYDEQLRALLSEND